jgi:hypothetical protein
LPDRNSRMDLGCLQVRVPQHGLDESDTGPASATTFSKLYTRPPGPLSTLRR